MSRKKQPRWSIRFELAPENPDDVKLFNYLDKLAENDEKSAWIRKVLSAAVPADVSTTKPEPPKTIAATFEPPDPVVTPASVKGNIPAAPDVEGFLKAMATKPTKPGMATTKNPNLEVPPGYSRQRSNARVPGRAIKENNHNES